MTESNQAHSIKARLLNMADKNNKRYQQLVVRYMHERLLFRLSRSEYRDKFILKGGALLYAFEEFVPRPTLDLDFMGRNISNDNDSILDVFKRIVQIPFPEDGISFLLNSMTVENITVDKKYPGVRIGMTACLGTYIQNLTLDIGFGDVIVPRPIAMEYPTVFETMEEPEILAYSLETVIAEKFQTIIDRGRFNSRMKDFFDLYRIFSVHQFEKDLLNDAIKATFENRQTELSSDNDFFDPDFGVDPMMNKQWENYVRKMKIDLPSFQTVHTTIVNYLLPYCPYGR